MALVQALAEHSDDALIQRNWGKMRSGGGKHRQDPKPVKPRLALPEGFGDEAKDLPPAGASSRVDHLPVGEQILTQTIIEVQERFEPEIEQALNEIDDFLAKHPPNTPVKPTFRVVAPTEPEPTKPKKGRLEKLTRAELSRMFQAMFAEQDGDDDWSTLGSSGRHRRHQGPGQPGLAWTDSATWRDPAQVRSLLRLQVAEIGQGHDHGPPITRNHRDGRG